MDVSTLMLHTPVIGFAVALGLGAVLGWQTHKKWMPRIAMALATGIAMDILLEAARLALKGCLA